MSSFSKRWQGVAATALLIMVTVLAKAQTNYQRFKSFGATDTGTHPHAALLLGTDGVLYGTTLTGGAANQGTVFRMNTDGGSFAILHHFNTNFDGKNPVGALLQGQDGLLYGSTVYGGSNRLGTVFRIARNGSGYSILHHFSKTALEGQFPYSSLVQDAGGNLYGTTSLTTNNGPGMVYKLGTNGSGFTVLHAFAANGVEGRNPNGMILGSEGVIYGVTRRSSTTTGGLFRLNGDGTVFSVFTNLPTSGLRAHMTGVRPGTNGLLYGTVCYNTNAEVIYSIATNGSGYVVLHTFVKDGVDGQHPDTQLLSGLDGALYGTTVAGGTNGAGTIFKINSDGGSYTILYHFKTNDVDGRGPEDSLVQGANGTLYGTTLNGGFSGDGTIYSIQPDGSGYTQLHQFNSYASEGQMPAGALASDGTGTLWGTTHRGGEGNNGTLFRINAMGSNYSVVRHFGGAADGQWPSGKLLRGTDGAWYGTTYAGGSNCGTVFKVNGDSTGYSVLHRFSGTNEGDVPYDALVQDAAGFLYGTTAAGGSNDVGTVFKLSTNGGGVTVLHTFLTNKVDGASPSGGLALANDGFLYGATEAGGTNNAGTVFKMAKDGSSYAVLWSFRTNGGDGMVPGAGVLLGDNSVLYGTTQRGGAQGAGTVFSLHTDGSGYAVLQSLNATLTNTLSFNGGAGGLVRASSNAFYGVVYEGGTSNDTGGLVFQVGTNGGGFTVVQNFGAYIGDGLNPSGPMTPAGAAWYGMTRWGGRLWCGFALRNTGRTPKPAEFEPAALSPRWDDAIFLRLRRWMADCVRRYSPLQCAGQY